MTLSGLSIAAGNQRPVSRRAVLTNGGAGLTALSLFSSPAFARMLGMQPGENVIPRDDRREDNPMPDVIRNQPEWEEIDSWITPNERFFGITRYEYVPQNDAADWRLSIGGLVRKPMTPYLDGIRSRPSDEVTALIDCAGNHGLPFLDAGICNARWAGTPRVPLLEEAGFEDGAVDIVFFGADSGEEEVHGVTTEENFARAMSLGDAMDADALLAYHMNGEDLPARNGYPLRLIVPGWYGMANVKWLERFEAHATRYMGRFQADEYVTLRAREVDGTTARTRNMIDRYRLKSVPAQVTELDGAYRRRRLARGRTHRPAAGCRTRLELLVARLGRRDRWRTHGHRARHRHKRQRAAGAGRSRDRQQAHLLGKQRPGHAAHRHRLTVVVCSGASSG